MIRTPGHFYLVEEYFPNYINLEDFVALRCPQGRLTETQAYTVLYQLVDVVRSALHRPIFIAHRDIKPENILIHPKTLHVLILDFGLATHFSGSEPRLTTCCGSPAFHSPELWLSLKSPPGSVRYWVSPLPAVQIWNRTESTAKGPEVDVWCIGVAMLRCLVGKRCPLGTSHSSLQDLSDKVIDTVLTIPHQELRNIVASLLDMNGDKRMEHFVELTIPASPDGTVNAPTTVRDFKSTTFVPTTAKHSLHLPIEQLSPPTTRARTLSGADTSRPMSRSASTAADKTALGSSTCCLILVNPDQQPATSVVSFIKYALRCSGVLYHVLPDNQASASFSTLPTPDVGAIQDKETDKFSSAFQQPNLTSRPIYLHCVMTLSDSDPTAIEQRKRPSLLRAYTAGTRPVSMPPSTDRSTKANAAAKDKKISCLQFWMSMVLEEDTSKRRKKKRTAQKNDFSSIVPSRITIRVSDKRAFNTVHSALELGKSASSRHGSPSSPTMPLQDSDRGRPAHRRGISSTGDSTSSDSPTSLSEPPPRGKSVDALNLYRSSPKEDAEERDKPSVVGNLLESARKGIGSISRSASKLRISDMGQEEEDDSEDHQLSMKQQQKDQRGQYHQAAVFM